MGLDMYLYKYPRRGNYTAQDIEDVESWLSWKHRPEKYKNDTPEQWCGLPEERIPGINAVATFEHMYIPRYYEWDDEHKYPHDSISQQVAYWRKANAIHNWFVDNVQDGEDDCGLHNEVTEDILEDLLDTCETILANVVLVPGKVENGKTFENGVWKTCYEDGVLIDDPSICQELLPTTDGFFFGGTSYDQYYLEDIKYTAETIRSILDETDFDNEMIFYRSSW